MNRIAVIADIHANLEALSAVLNDIKNNAVNEIICLGDIVGYNASPAEAVTLIIQNKIVSINGNHDRYVTNITSIDPSVRKSTVDVVEWTRKMLAPEHIAFLASLPKQRQYSQEILVVHGSPRFEDEYILTLQSIRENLGIIERFHPGVRICFFGHTHVPLFATRGTLYWNLQEDKVMDVSNQGPYLINPGSVGQPRDGCPKSAYCIFDAETKTITFHRVKYDIKETQEKIIKAGLDKKLAERLELGR